MRDVAADGGQVVWANYDVSTGRSARAVIDRAPLSGGDAVEVAEEHHPPDHLAAYGGHVYWLYKGGGLKRAPLAGGPTETLKTPVEASCFTVGPAGVVYIESASVTHLDPATRTTRVLVKGALGDCPVVIDDTVYWTERKGIHSVPLAGAEERGKLADVKVPKGLVVHGGALYTCLDEVLTRIDPADGTLHPVRSYCKPDGLVVGEEGHWMRVPHFEGWPPQEYVRIAEVTREGVSWLFDGEGASVPALAGDQLVWFGRERGASSDWRAFAVPLP